MVFPIGKESPGLWVDVRVCVPELSVAVGAVQDIVPVAEPLSVTPDTSLGHPLITGPSTSEIRKIKIYMYLKFQGDSLCVSIRYTLTNFHSLLKSNCPHIRNDLDFDSGLLFHID